MASSNGPGVPSGRSPYPPTRNNRRRLSAELPSNMDESAISSSSPFFLSGQGLLRGVSPSASNAAWTPPGGRSGAPRRFFEPAGNNAGMHPGSAYSTAPFQQPHNRTSTQQPPNSSSHAADRDHQTESEEHTSAAANNNGNRSTIPTSVYRHHNAREHTNDLDEDQVIDDIHITKLRKLAKEALGTPAASALPSTAVFYASLLYAKTQSDEDAFLYAQALARNGESKRCVRLLEQSRLIQSSTLAELRFEAILLAAEALSALGEWQSVLDLLEDASQLTAEQIGHYHQQQATPAMSTWSAVPQYPLEDEDDIAWDSLFRSVQTPEGYIHPISRLCLWRGRAYSETGHPIRAALYWKRAIRMDPKCVQALDFLLARSVVTPQEAFEVIEGLTWEPQMEWMRNLYLARIELSPQDVGDQQQFSSSQEDEQDAHMNNMTMNTMQNMPQAETPFSINPGHSHYLDASSIQMATPSMLQTPRGDGMQMDHLFGFQHKNNNTSKEGDNFLQTERKFPTKSALQESVDDAFSTLWNVHKLQQSPEVLAMAARRAYRRYDLNGALQHCQQLAAIDPLCQSAGYVYISTLAALGHKRHLFSLAHEWVEASPKSARAWFAVGSYYYACERYHVAQRHFCRATRLDPHCTEAWIAFGCSFATCDESDQALASFRAAQRLSPGEYASLLYMGMEYLRTNHLVLAQYFLTSAFKASGGDPLCLNELGVLSIHRGDHEAAIGWFVRALRASVQDHFSDAELKSVEECIELCQDKHWEATIFNLGQCYRKTRRFAEAACCFERCTALSPGNCSGYAALAFTKHLMGDIDGAIDLYHQALSCKPDDPFSSEMLNKALQEALSSSFSAGEDENKAQNPAQRAGPPRAKNLFVSLGQHVTSKMAKDPDWSNKRDDSRTSHSMMSDDALNLSAESEDVDMSLA